MLLYKIYQANKSSFLLLVLLVALPIFVSSTVGYFVLQHEDKLREFVFWQWLIFYAAAGITMAFALTPTTFIALISGYFLGWQSLPFMAFAYFAASFIGYKAALFFDHGKFIQTLTGIEGVDKIIQNLKIKEFMIIVLSRLSPVLPFAMMNVLLAISGARLKTFLIAGFIGMLPRTLMFIWIGTRAKHFSQLIEHPTEDTYIELLIFAMLLISMFGLFYYFKRALNKAH